MSFIARRATLAAPTLLSFPAWTQPTWPQRPVRLVIPFAPGGAADTLARTVGQALGPLLGGQPLVIDNRPGGGGTVAAAHVAQSAPDGHTLLIADIGANAVAGAMFERLPYDPARAFAPIIHLVNLPMVLIARPDAPFTDPAGLLAAARAAPGRFTYSSAGPGGASHLAMELLNRAAGMQTVHVPYRGGSQVVTAVIAREVDISIGTVSFQFAFASGQRTAARVPMRHVFAPCTWSVVAIRASKWLPNPQPAGE